MPNKKPVSQHQLEAFMQRLRQRPDLYERFSQILDLTDPGGAGHGLDIHQLEGFLRPAIRETGRTALSEFVEQLEQAAAEQLKAEGPVRQREKKTSASSPSTEK